MAQVAIEINNKKYNIACDDGQEERVYQLAGYINERLNRIAGSNAGTVSTDSHLLVLTSLILTDEIFELQDSLQQSGSQHPQQQGASLNAEETELITQAVDHLRQRVEKLTKEMRLAA